MRKGDLLGEGLYLPILNSIILRHMNNFLTCENIFNMMLSLKRFSKNLTAVRHTPPKIKNLPSWHVTQVRRCTCPRPGSPVAPGRIPFFFFFKNLQCCGPWLAERTQPKMSISNVNIFSQECGTHPGVLMTALRCAILLLAGYQFEIFRTHILFEPDFRKDVENG